MAQDCQLYIVKWSVLSESTGLFNPVLSVSANEVSYDKILANQIMSFNLMLGPVEHYSPSPLGDSNRLFEGLIGVSIKLWHLNMTYSLIGINLAKNVKFVSLICW